MVVYNIMCKYKPPVNNDMIIKQQGEIPLANNKEVIKYGI